MDEAAPEESDTHRLQDMADLEEAGDSPQHRNSRPPLQGNAGSASRPTSSGSAAALGPNSPTVAEDLDKSPRSSYSHWDPEPGFAHVDGDVGGTGYNETKVDIIAVPCPGADPVETWTRDPLPDTFFTRQEVEIHPVTELAGATILTPAIDRQLPKALHIWVRQGIRKEISTARVMLYRHRALADGLDLDTLADDLLEQVMSIRANLRPSRPIFFVAHSIGGLVVKLAILKASQIQKYRSVMYNCHGVSFFATPHRGSSYLSMPNLSESIRGLLSLSRPLPRSIAGVLRLGNKWLLKLHDNFMNVSSELRVWSFYETIDSQLSGSGYGFANEVQFFAPIVSIKSGILGVRQENVFAVESDHANCASFGQNNLRTLGSYLDDLGKAVSKAQELSDLYIHNPLKLKDHVRVELIGFYEDPDAEMESTIRLYFTKYKLSDFLNKGPEKCLEERLSRVPRRRSRRTRPSRSANESRGRQRAGLGIWTGMQKVWKTVSTSPNRSRDSSPDIVVTQPSARPSLTGGTQSMPAEVMQPVHHSLTIPAHAQSEHERSASRATASTSSEPVKEASPPRSGRRAGSTGMIAGHRANSLGPPTERIREPVAMQSRDDRMSRASAFEDMAAGFSRPDPSRRKFMWIHLPFTNPPWVKDIFDKLSETHYQNFSRLFNNENWVSRHVQGRHSQAQPSFIRPACNYLTADAAPSPRGSPHPNGKGAPTVSPNYLYLYLPYLHYDTYASLIRRRNLIARRMAHGRARPVPEDIAGLESLELRVLWEYLGFDPPLNSRRTLDQFGYPSLRDTFARDDDQMLYKLTKKVPYDSAVPRSRTNTNRTDRTNDTDRTLGNRMPTQHSFADKSDAKADSDDECDVDDETQVKDGNVLMVDQVWLWAIDTTTLTTFFPKRESSAQEGTMFQQADLRNSVYNELNGDLTGRCENALDLAAFVALHAVTVLLDRSSHPDLEIFRIFEEAIGILTERLTSAMKQFRSTTFKDVDIDDSDGDDFEESRDESIKVRYKREIEKAERENRESTSALMELRDMEDELSILSRLFDVQEQTLITMKNIYEGKELRDITRNGRIYLHDALTRLAEYKAQVAEMRARVDTTRKDYEKLLELAQRQAQVDDVRWSRLQTDLAASQNLSVMIFTIFTVIFLPLTFFTGLFGMNTYEWGSSDGEFLSLGTIGEISLPASAFLIIGSLVAAFSSRFQAVFRFAGRRAWKAIDWARDWARRLEPAAARAAKARRLEARERHEEARQRRKDRAYDFWGDVRRQRSFPYQIPVPNRIAEHVHEQQKPSQAAGVPAQALAQPAAA